MTTIPSVPKTQYWKGHGSTAENKLENLASLIPPSVEFYLTASRKGVPMLIVKSSKEDNLMFSVAYMKKRGHIYRVFHGYQRYAAKGRQVRRDFQSIEKLAGYIVMIAFMSAIEVAKIKPSFVDAPAFKATQDMRDFYQNDTRPKHIKRMYLDPDVVAAMMDDDPIGPH